MKIITTTLNPAFDLHCSAESFAAGEENFADVTSLDAGGKGINVTRALKSAEFNSTAVLLLGSDNGEEFLRQLLCGGIAPVTVKVPGRIRENVTVHEKNGRETRLSFGGFSVNDDVFDTVKRKILSEARAGDTVTFTGSLPCGITAESVTEFIIELKRLGIKAVIDSRSFSLDDLIKAGAYFIKPNRTEAEAYLGHGATENELLSLAEKLYENGTENVAISLGKDGCLLMSNEGKFKAVPLQNTTVISTVGAGDSTVAGFLYATANGKKKAEALKTAVAFGTAACMQSGTCPPKYDDIASLLPKIELIKL